MSLRVQARNRLLILIGAAVAIVVLGGAYLSIRTIHNRRFYADLRQRGMAAVTAADDPTVVNFLGQYLKRYPNDIQALGAYVKSQPKVPDINGNLGPSLDKTRGSLQHLLQLDPNRPDDWRALMHLYAQFNMQTEAIDAADNLLVRKPNDGDALALKANSLLRVHKYKESLDTAMLRLAATPDDWPTQFTRMSAMGQLGSSNADILKVASDLAKSYPNDQGSLLLEAMALRSANDFAGAHSALMTAATQPSRDPIVAVQLVQQLNIAGEMETSMRVLRSVAATGDMQARRLLLRRLWEESRVGEAVMLFASTATATTQPALSITEPPTQPVPFNPPAVTLPSLADAASTTSMNDSESLGIYADCLRHIPGQQSQSAAVKALLSKRAEDPMAVAWVAIESDSPPTSREQAMALRTACSAASVRLPKDPYLLYFQAMANKSLGDVDIALDLWTKAAQNSFTWTTPLIEESQTLLTLGRLDDALSYGREAQRRGGNSYPVAINFAALTFGKVETGKTTPAETQQALDFITALAKQSPIGQEILLTEEASLLGRLGKKDEAIATIRSTMDRKPQISPRTYLVLANISRQWQLNIENDCIAAMEQVYGRTPESALSLALEQWQALHDDTGLTLLRAALAAAKPDQTVAFGLALASYMEETGTNAATAEWAALGDQYPEDLAVQQLALASHSAYADRAFYGRTIERMHTLLGDDSIVWKLAKGRYLLDGDPSPKNITDALDLLNDVVRRDPNSVGGHIFLGKARERAGDLAGATSEFAAAQRLDPNSTATDMELAALLQYRGNFAEAHTQLDMAAKADQSPASRAHIAMMMAQQGDVQGGIAILEPLVVADSPEDQKLALVTLYCRDKQFDKALTLCLDLLKKTPEQMRVDPLAPGILVQSASVYEFQRRPLDAEQVLTRLQELKLDPGVYEQTIGDFRYNFGSIATAEQLYRQATVAAPKNYIPWMCLMDTEALMGHTDDMLATANEALKNCPDNPQIKAVVAQADLMKSVGVGPTQQRLISSLVKDPSPDGPAVMTLRRMAELNASDDTVDQVLLGLKKLAADLPRFLPAQTALIEAQIRLGRAEDAVQTAARVVEAFPTETQPAQLGVAALQAVRRPDEALHMAETWRARVVGDTLLADLTIAQIQTSLGQPQAALDILKPHLDAPYTSDAEKWQMLLAVAAADFKLGKPDDGTQMMWPAVEKSPANRIQWMDIIANNLPAPKAAEWLGKMTDILNKEPNSGPALMNMARDYDLLSMRSHDMHYAKTAREIAQHVEQSAPDIAPQAALLQGMFAEEDADFTGAEGDYRRAFSKTDLPDARNNLAMLLADHGGNLTEAVELVNQSIKSAPNSATYYDTLATLLERQRKFDEAAAAMQMALHLQPNNPKWHVNLASLLVSAGKRDQAKQMVDELDLMTPGVRILTKEYQDKLAVLRIQVGVPTTTMPAQFTIPQ